VNPGPYLSKWENGFNLNKDKTMNTSILSNMEGVLSRSEMKSIIAGDGGNIYCNGPSGQYKCEEGDLFDCVDDCADTHGTDCNGCAEFPECHDC
jgi:hypothetical protein